MSIRRYTQPQGQTTGEDEDLNGNRRHRHTFDCVHFRRGEPFQCQTGFEQSMQSSERSKAQSTDVQESIAYSSIERAG